MQRLKNHLLIIIFLISYFAVTAYKFIAYPTPFYDWDESIYAQVGKEMVQQKSIVPLWQGQYWLDKPPLVPLAYGIVESIVPLKPELSTRLFTLSLTIILFIFIYYFYYKLTKNGFISFLTVVISSFTSIFLQRAQVLNVDTFLFLGWMGYLVFYEHFWLSFLFLAIGVLSKSLLGFYPVILIFGLHFYQLFTKSISFSKFIHKSRNLVIQSSILLLWYVGMFLYFKYPFIQAHFLDSMAKRVTASIESHFGKRTFYIDLLFDELKVFAYLSISGTVLIVINFFRKRDIKNTLFLLFFIPWFLFLNLTKTKINWYLYPVIPQFAFLGVYILSYIKNKKIFLALISLFITGVIIFKNFSTNSFFGAHYSSYDENYELAIYAKEHCKELNVLVDKDSRTTHDTLQKMNLLIGTSEWWGNHPAIVYYSNIHVNFIYNIDEFSRTLNTSLVKTCFIVNESDKNVMTEKFLLQRIRYEKNLYLYIK
jgi:hypothetical protein